MKSIYFLMIYILILSCSNENENSQNSIEPEMLDYYSNMDFNGVNRTFFVHLPTNYNASLSYPIIFAMHGGGLLGYEGIEAQSKLSELSDKENFIVVYPEGIKTLGFRTWNAGDCCPSATLLETDDVGFINALLDKLKQELAVNIQRVYAAGFSNGGQLAYKLANRYPNKFAAVSSVAGVLQDFPYNPSRNIPIIHFHSYLDQTAPYFGGQSDAPNINIDFPSVESTLETIANAYDCDLLKEVMFSNPNTYDYFLYSNCDDNALLKLYVSRDGGHTWPGGEALPNNQVTTHFNASELMWDFFKNYKLE